MIPKRETSVIVFEFPLIELLFLECSRLYMEQLQWRVQHTKTLSDGLGKYLLIRIYTS